MRVLVTGATGFIGQHLTKQLLQAGHEPVLLVREAYGMAAPLPPVLNAGREELHLVYADLRNYRLTLRAVDEAAPDAVFHLAAAGVSDPFLAAETALRHNLNGTLNLLRACFARQTGSSPSRLIVARTPGELSAMNVYAASKSAAWQFCQMYAKAYQWPIVGAMIFQAYGTGQPAHTLIPAALAAALAGRDFHMTQGNQQRDWIFVSDVVHGLIAMLGSSLTAGLSVDLGTGKPNSVKDVVVEIYRLVGRQGSPQPGAIPSRPGETAIQVANAARSHDLLMWRADTELSEGLSLMLADLL